MNVTRNTFNRLVIILSLLAALLLPIWPYSRWGYAPSVLLVVIVIVMFMLQRLARN